MTDTHDVAFALGGLAGNNAHGAGFLQAALDPRVRPMMISCTTGQILWAYRYLCCLSDDSLSLRKELQEDISSLDAFHNPDLDLAALPQSKPRGFFGYVFEDMDVFERAARDARKRLSEDAGKQSRPASPRTPRALASKRKPDAELITASGITQDSI
jgi:hypothetical protein